MEELSRISDEEMVRRQFLLRNLGWMSVLLTVFTFAPPLILYITTKYGSDVSNTELQSTVSVTIFNALFLLVVALLRRHPPKRGVNTLVVFFIVVEFLWMMLPLEPGSWGAAGFVAFFFVRFRLPEKLSYALHAFYLTAAGVMALLAPITISKGDEISASTANLIAIIFSIVFIAAALALQIHGARRVRREILDEWREPLTSAREQARMRDELRYAREMQLAMLPEAPPRLEWIDLAGVSLPAAEVGGDYYDFFHADGQLAIVTADVAGHGMASGLVLAAMRGGFTVLRRSMGSPAAVLEQLHDLVAHNRHRMLATAAVVRIDRHTRRATIASAGHPPIVMRRNGSAHTLDLHALPLGARLPLRIPEQSYDLVSGDLLVLHSDGVYESRNGRGETYGLDRLLRIVEAQEQHAAAEVVRDAILADVATFRGNAAQEDDVTVVVARLT